MQVPRAQPRRRLLLFAVCILAFAALAAVHVETSERNARLARQSFAVESAITQLWADFQSAAWGANISPFTADDRALASFELVIRNMEQEIGNLRDLVSRDPERLQTMERLQAAIDERLALLKSRVKAARAGREDAVLGGALREMRVPQEAVNLLVQLAQDERQLFQKNQQAYFETSWPLEIALGFLFFMVAGAGLHILLASERRISALEASTKRLGDELMEQSRQHIDIEARLRQAQKLDALGHLASGVAHDFNNMLAIIVASLNLLRRKLGSAASECEMLVDAAEEGANKAARLASRLLAFSREQPLDPRVINVNELILGMSLIFRQIVGATITVDFALADDLWNTCLDPHELENALVNLAVNAADAMPGGGSLVIKTENVVVGEADGCSGLRPGAYVKIFFADTGKGMAPDVVARALEPFFTTKSAAKGTGLGLAQVHSFVKQSRGEILLESELGQGTNISMFFPRFLGVSEPFAPSADLKLARFGEALLIVDDDVTARRLLVLAARELGYIVYEAGSPDVALKLLEEHSEIALLVTDLVLPGMDGSRLAKEAIIDRKTLCVIFITGFSRTYLFSQNIRAEGVLSKPFSLHQFADAVRLALDRKGQPPELSAEGNAGQTPDAIV
ncbi:ATP-binding protein [Methylocystis echinoides]|uniref:ATP-binding protein n=1 Tax=Methylocystis echinoides TaxID=29468 RepID=UPI00342B716E